MKDKLLVSIIIPVFNVSPFLAEAVDSVVNQTYKNLEIIIIDDGSTDGSSEICDVYSKQDSRIRTIHQANQGLSAARNVGLDVMTGSVVAFLDSDDKYQPEFVLSMLSAMVQYDADIVICKNTVLRTMGEMTLHGNENATPAILQGVYDRSSSLRAHAEGFINSNVWNKLYSAKLWKTIRFPVGRVYEDIATIYQLLNLCNQVYVLNKTLYIRRIRSGSIIHTHYPQNCYDCAWALSQFESFITENTPGVYDSGHLIRVRKKRLRQMIACYALCAGNRTARNSINTEELRQKIIDLGSKDGLAGFTLRVKTTYYLVRYCPWILRIIYPIYRGLR